MKIKAKLTDEIIRITPEEWRKMESNGTSKEYEIIERNTIWAEALDNYGSMTGKKRSQET